jgi:hypothetical protein
MSLVPVPQLSVQQLRSDFSGKNSVIDALLTRYDQLESEAMKIRTTAFSQELTYETPNGIRLANPLLGAIVSYERLMHYTLRELGFAVRMYDQDHTRDEDSVDTFLASLGAHQRPHHAMNRPIDATGT